MKLNRYIAMTLAGATLFACSDIDEMVPQGGTLLATQVQETNNAAPSRVEAQFSGMYSKLGEPLAIFGSSGRPDDYGFIMMAFSNDLEAADMVTANNDYNWFSTCMELSSRNPDYANPYVRYASPYNQIAAANDIIKALPADSEEAEVLYKLGQARAMRAFAYLNLAPYFQRNYQIAADEPCVPIVTETTTDFTNNPRASVKDVYTLIVDDLTYAIEKLEGFVRPDKAKIDQQVAYGLRARAYLDMGMWAEAASDAEKAMEGYTPATIEEVSKPFLYDLTEHNWLWGYDMTIDMASVFTYATSSSWVRSFSGDGYAPATATYSKINNLLYNKIPATDVRKGWWVDENLHSPLLQNVSWNGATGDDVAALFIENVKEPFEPLTNVKFGMYTYGSTTNEEDWPFMRVEEMILIQAEGYVRGGNEPKGKQILEDFVKTYRDPSYSADAGGRTLVDEIWFQRRVELWGEGFSNADTRRLNKPFVRFHDSNSNMPEAFRFNLKADDPHLLMHFCKSETNTNLAIVDNPAGNQPEPGQNADLRDGVTD
ncbi:MAG: RagB/SusD family nutrient uptake outer membrane protein [Bacteroidales bacterium]|nr:RagB/SusD family nutrient uptake outer membrane protein [Bacteroidales bacterium]